MGSTFISARAYPHAHIRTRQRDANGDLTLDRNLIIDGPAAEIMIRGRARRVRAYRDHEALGGNRFRGER